LEHANAPSNSSVAQTDTGQTRHGASLSSQAAAQVVRDESGYEQASSPRDVLVHDTPQVSVEQHPKIHGFVLG
jgi:hypothetical protein